ncbi:MAG: SusC/RagA family TonB-linked outer membrane protein [Saprospiraceae bacterium]
MKKILLSFTYLLLLSSTVFGQETLIKGLIQDEKTKEPLIGVTVIVVDTDKGVVTDYDGKFMIKANLDDQLSVSYIGYKTQIIEIKNQSELTILLSSEVSELDEIVVVGYGTRARRDITSSVASVSTEDIEKKPFARLENALQGKAAGVQVTQYSGKPGNAISVRVRGATSLSAGNEPLYVLDGVPILNTEGINPADIASIEIMKDASASAIYGARAANGVVLITTKRGEAGQSRISVSSNIGISQVTRTLPLLNGEQYVDLINESYINAGQSPVLDAANFTENTDWQDEIFRNAITNDLQLSFSGGSENTNYFISANRNAQEGIVLGSDFQRLNFRSNFDTKLRDGVKVGTSITVSKIDFNNVPDNSRVNQGGVILGALSSPPIIGIYNEDGTFTTNPLQAWENPVANIEAPIDVASTTRLVGNVYTEIDVIENLKFKSSFGTETYYNKNDYFLDPFSTQFGRSLEGIATTSTNRELVWLWENTLNYNLKRGNHDFDFLGGITAQESGYEGTFARAEGFPNAAITTLNAGSRKIEANSFASQWAIFSYLGRASYKFSDKYLADLSFRADGSSRFGAGNRFAYFPSLSLGWRLSEEDFLKNNETIDDLKLRASAGTTGNQNIGDFTSIGLYSTGSNYVFNDVILPGTRPATISNEDLRWETTAQINAGFDVALFDFRVNLTGDFYYKRTQDLLINVDLPRSTGFGSGIQNLGEVENMGWELTVRSYNIRKDKFTWSTQFNISANRNKVLDIGGEDQVIFAGGIPERGFSVIVQEGLPLGTFYGYKSLGVNPDNGDIVFEDINDDGIINEDDRTIIGDANPDFIIGLSNTFTYGGFTLDILLQSSIGNDVFNATRIETEGMFSVKNGSAATLDRWQNAGDVTRVPRAVFGDPNENSRISDRFIENGSFLRIRNITLSYNLPQSIVEKVKIQGLSLFASGQNLWILSDYSGYDPEVNRDGGSAISQGIDFGTYPQARIMTGGIKLDF